MNADEREILARAREGSKAPRAQRLAQYEERDLRQLPGDVFNAFELSRVLLRRQDRQQLLGNILTGLIVGVILILVKYLAGVP